LKKVEAGEKI